MANSDGGKVRAIDWGELFPWLILFRAFRIAIQLRLLVLAAVAMVLTVTGWALLVLVFSGDPTIGREMEPYGGCPWLAVTEVIPDGQFVRGDSVGTAADIHGNSSILARGSNPAWGTFLGWRGPFWNAWNPVFGTWEQLGRPFYRMFAAGSTFTRAMFLLVCGLWALVVWSFFGAAITRAAAYELGTRERLGFWAAIRHAAVSGRSHLGAVLIPLVGMLLLTFFLFLAGLVLRIELFGIEIGLLLGAVFWPIALVLGFLLTVLVLGSFFGWPLFWASLGAERPDSYEAISRGYQYVYQRPFHYLFYTVVAALFGALGWMLVSFFVSSVIGLTWWAVGWGAGAERVERIALTMPATASATALPGYSAGPEALDAGEGEEAISGVGAAGAGMIRFWVQCLKLLGVGYLFSYFWVSMTVVYLLLRRNVDSTELDDVYVEEEPHEPLPPIRTDERGAPKIDPAKEDAE